MLVDESKYIWRKTDPIIVLIPESSHTENFVKPLKIYRIEGVGTITLYVDEDQTEEIYNGTLPYEPDAPFVCDSLVFTTETLKVEVSIIAEVGEEKTVLTPFLNTSNNMEAISNGYTDDRTYQTEGLVGFKFNGLDANLLYISSNHWIGFGTNSEQFRILRRDGCSTVIYRQLGETTNGLQFLKIRFEGYTVYNSRVESNRLIFELFLLSNNDMFLNVIQTPTSGNIGTSNFICNNATTELTLADGNGGGKMVSFYHQDKDGRTWNIVYEMYETIDYYSYAYLIKSEDVWYTIADDVLVKAEIENLTAAMFMKYGCEELPSNELLTQIANPHIYLWKAGGEQTLLKDTVKAYPYPQIITSIIDMSHISILGIAMMTAQYSGDVTIRYSINNGKTFSDDIPIIDWLNTNTQELWESLNEDKKLMLQFILHDNASITSFKITYEN